MTKGIELIKRLSLAMGPSGCEDEVRDVIREEIGDAADSVTEDRVGNLIVKVRGRGMDYNADKPARLLVAAHMDEVGFMVKDVTDEGYIRFSPIGGMDPRVLCGRHVTIRTEKGKDIPAMIATKAIHLQSAEERAKATPTDKMYLDIGTRTKEEGFKTVSVGDYGVFDSDFVTFGKDNGRIKGKALDDRLGCAALIETIRSLHDLPCDLPFDVYFAFTCNQLITGISCAGVAAFTVEPDMALMVEATAVNDLPGMPAASRVASLGGGCVLSLCDSAAIYDPALTAMLTRTAAEAGIPTQIKQSLGDVTDGGFVQRSMAGVKTALLSVPVRYAHTAASVAMLSDYEAARDLMIAALRKWKV